MERRDVAGPLTLRTFAALAYQNYRLWFVGQMTSLFRTWFQTTARGCLFCKLTHSEAYLGYSGVAARAFGILAIIGLPGSVILFCMSFATLIPTWAVMVLHGHSRINGFLQSARGGALGTFLFALMAALLVLSIRRLD
jgi:hypothetical protein